MFKAFETGVDLFKKMEKLLLQYKSFKDGKVVKRIMKQAQLTW